MEDIAGIEDTADIGDIAGTADMDRAGRWWVVAAGWFDRLVLEDKPVVAGTPAVAAADIPDIRLEPDRPEFRWGWFDMLPVPGASPGVSPGAEVGVPALAVVDFQAAAMAESCFP